MFAKAFGTTPVHELPQKKDLEKTQGMPVAEALDPSPALDFLSHLGVSRHEVHSRVASALRSAIEDEIQRMPIAPLTTTPDGVAKTLSTPGEAGHGALLNLLKSAWQFRDVPELRPVLVTVLKRLGDHTPVPMLRRLGTKQNKTTGLKNAELVSQLGPHLQRLVWEADWDAKLELVTKSDGGQALSEEELTLRGSTILADLLRESVDKYLADAELAQAADLAFVGTVSERRFATKLRRIGAKVSEGAGHTREKVSTLASIGVTKAQSSTGNEKEEKSNPSTAVAVATIKETIGKRPKLLGAILDMLIAEHATKGGGLGYIKTLSIKKKREKLLDDTTAGSISILGGSTNLSCPLVADILLTFGQLPRSYEVLDIMARILDAAVQSGFISDNSIAQIQGCLRTIFRPSQAEQSQAIQSSSKDKVEGTKIKLSLKPTKASTSSSMFPDLPVDDSQFERKLLQRVLKKAIASMKEHDPQGLFLNQVTDAIAPGYFSIIDKPICIRAMEEKVMSSSYKSIDEYKDDTLLLFSNCCKYNTGAAGQWFRTEAGRQKKIWKEEIFSEAKSKFKADMAKRKNALKRKPKPPPPLAFAPGKSDKPTSSATEIRAKEAKEDKAINNLTAEDVKPLPPWKYKRRKTEIVVPSMQCLAAMLLADPFVVRVLMDRIQKILKVDVLKTKSVPAGHHALPSIFQLLNIARISTQLCALKGKRCYIPDAGLRNVLTDGEEFNPSYESTRNCLPLLSKLLLDAELDRRMAIGGDLHEAALQDILTKPELQIKEWDGTSTLYDLRAVVEGALVYLLQPGNTNEAALQAQFPRFEAALDELSGGNMLNERPFLISMTYALLRFKSKLPHSTRDLVTGCMIKWLKKEEIATPKTAICSPLHECFMHLLNEWSSLGNLVLPRDLFLSLGEEAVAASSRGAIGQKCQRFAKLWASDDDCFSAVKEQYTRMLSSTPDARARQWKETMGIADEPAPTSPAGDDMQDDP